MPFKHNAARRHRIPKTRYRVQNWPAYEAGLKRRGDLTLWLDEAALARWQAPRRTTPGGQARYLNQGAEQRRFARAHGLVSPSRRVHTGEMPREDVMPEMTAEMA